MDPKTEKEKKLIFEMLGFAGFVSAIANYSILDDDYDDEDDDYDDEEDES